jgi:hypothetical protein
MSVAIKRSGSVISWSNLVEAAGVVGGGDHGHTAGLST